MDRLRSAVTVALSLASLCLLVAGPAEGAPGTNTHLLGASEGLAGSSTPGKQLWVKRYNGPGNSDDYATALGVSPEGTRVFVTGQSIGSTSSFDYATVAHDAPAGTRLWVSRYNGPGNYSDSATALEVSPNGSKVFATGSSSGSTSGYDYATLAYNASTGAQLWVSRYNGPGNRYDFATAAGVSPDGSTVFVTGYSRGLTSANDYATVAYDAPTGTRLWVSRYNGPANLDDDAAALEVSPDGSSVFVTGYTRRSRASGGDYGTVAYNASTGAQLWVSRYNGPANLGDYATDLGVSPDGSTVFVTGYSVGSTSDFDYATVAYDASTGTRLWVSRYNGPGNYTDEATNLGVSPDGSTVFVTGESFGATSSLDYATLAYNASTGAQLWVSRYNGPGNSDDYATALGVSPEGTRVFVTGGSWGSTSSLDYATLAYNSSTGGRVWVARYNGPGNGGDAARAFGMSADGSKVFVTGESTGSTSGYDYATVAYSIT